MDWNWYQADAPLQLVLLSKTTVGNVLGKLTLGQQGTSQESVGRLVHCSIALVALALLVRRKPEGEE